jgi:hypothetical protein
MLVEPIYKGFRIQVDAVEVEGRWDALVNIHRVFSDEKPHRDRVTCRKMTAELAEHVAAVWARRWVDLHGTGLAEPRCDSSLVSGNPRHNPSCCRRSWHKTRTT